MFLMNSWYVAAWDHELIDGKLLARTILGKPVLLYKGESGRVVALDNRCCHRGAQALQRPHGRRRRALHVPRAEVRPERQVHPDPGPGQHSAQARRAQLPGGRAPAPGLDLDGRGGEGRSRRDPGIHLSARPGLARQARLHALRRELSADRRQPERLRAPRLRAHEDARRLGGIRLQVQADRDRAPRATASASSAGT